MMLLTRYVVMKLLDNEGHASFCHVRQLIMVAMPGATGVASNSSPEELREEYDLVANEIEYLCGKGARISEGRSVIEVIDDKCRGLLRRQISKLEARKRSMPRLISMYLSAADAMLPRHTRKDTVE